MGGHSAVVAFRAAACHARAGGVLYSEARRHAPSQVVIGVCAAGGGAACEWNGPSGCQPTGTAGGDWLGCSARQQTHGRRPQLADQPAEVPTVPGQFCPQRIHAQTKHPTCTISMRAKRPVCDTRVGLQRQL